MRGSLSRARRAWVSLTVMRKNSLQLSIFFRKQLPAEKDGELQIILAHNGQAHTSLSFLRGSRVVKQYVLNRDSPLQDAPRRARMITFVR